MDEVCFVNYDKVHSYTEAFSDENVRLFIENWEEKCPIIIRDKEKNLEEQRKQYEIMLAERESKELAHQEYANSFEEYYEYDVVTIINENHGTVDKAQMISVINQKAREGWKLHTVYSNELGKNAIKVLGFGVNSTACEDVLIFERRIKNNQ